MLFITANTSFQLVLNHASYPWWQLQVNYSGTGTATIQTKFSGSGGITSKLSTGGSGGTPSGPAGGDLAGTYPNPTVANLSNVTNGSLPVAGLANPVTTINAVPCTIGSTCTVGGGPPSGTAGGDLSGTYPNPTVLRAPTVSLSCTVGAGGVTANTLVSTDSSAGAVPCQVVQTSVAATTWFGVALATVSAGGTVLVQRQGLVQVNSDGAMVLGDQVAVSTTVAGQVHDSGLTSRNLQSQANSSASIRSPCASACLVWIDVTPADRGTLVPNALLSNPATTVNSQTCTLGSSCTVSAAPNGFATGDLSGSYPAPIVTNLSNVGNSSLNNSGLLHSSTQVNGQTCTLGATCAVSANPIGLASGDLSGSYPSPTVINLSSVTNASLPNSGLVHSSTNVNGQNCTLGSGCTIASTYNAGTPFTGDVKCNTITPFTQAGITYPCAVNIGVLFAVFANPIFTFSGAATATTLDGTHIGVSTDSIFDFVSVPGGVTIAQNLYACASVATCLASGVVIWSSATSTPGATATQAVYCRALHGVRYYHDQSGHGCLF